MLYALLPCRQVPEAPPRRNVRRRRRRALGRRRHPGGAVRGWRAGLSADAVRLRQIAWVAKTAKTPPPRALIPHNANTLPLVPRVFASRASSPRSFSTPLSPAMTALLPAMTAAGCPADRSRSASGRPLACQHETRIRRVVNDENIQWVAVFRFCRMG